MTKRTSPKREGKGARKRPGRSMLPGGRAPGTALMALVLLGLVFLAQFHYLVPDSAAYLSYARSLLWDADVDFTNEYNRLGMIDRETSIEFGALTPAGRPGNPFGMGAAILWLPFVALAAFFARVVAAVGADTATDGFGTATVLAAHLGSWTYALLAVALIALSIREALPTSRRTARRTAVFAAFFGTPFVYYLFQMPGYSHTCSAFTVSLLLYLGLRWRTAWTYRRAVLLGAVLGLAGLVRIQDLGFWALPPILGWFGGALRGRGAAAAVGVYSAAAALVFAPQLLAWAAIYGGWRLPQGGGFLQFSPERLWKVLFASRHGLLSWSPVVLFAAAGWVLLAWRPASRGLGVALLAGFIVQWFVNSLPVDWWAGWSFGARRFTDCVPLVALGLAAVAERGRHIRIAIHALAAANLVQWLRVASGALSGETDPGWGALWGGGFFGFLPELPGALWHVARVPWWHLQVLRRPTAAPPSMHQDPEQFLAFFFVVWAVVVLAVTYRAMRMWPRERVRTGGGTAGA